jgi:hypothetical protein
MWRFFVFLLFYPVTVGATSICPSQIDVLENLKILPPGFSIFLEDNSWARPLTGLDFYDGRPENLVLQIPRSPSDSETIWRFVSTDPIWVVCHYKDSGLTLTRELPLKTTTCMVKLSDPQNGTLIGQRLVSSTTCW